MTGVASVDAEATAPPVSLAVVRAYLAMAREGGRRPGALAIQARPTWNGDRELALDDGVRAVIVPCVSALAVREALLSRPRDQWLVILTDRDNDDLGTGITTYLVHGKVRIPNLWDAVADQFAASQRDPQLEKEGRHLAATLLAETPPEGWLPARGGVLTRDVAFEALTARAFGLPAAQLDPLGLLEWSTDPDLAFGATRLPADVVEKVHGWLATRTGPLGAATVTAARTGALADAVPFAVLSGLLADPALPLVARAEARGLVGARLGAPLPGDAVSRGWAADARTALERLLHSESGRARARTLLDRAESILASAGEVADELAAASDVLPSGLRARRRAYAQTIRAVTHQPEADRLDTAETAFAYLAAHLLAEHDPGERLRLDTRDRMALRLARWLVNADTTPQTLGAAIARHLDNDGWVDRARADVWAGVVDPAAEDAYRALYDAIAERRHAHDRVFAELVKPNFARTTDPGSFVYLEDALATVVLPTVAHSTPTLLVLADGMSAAVANELAEQITALGWVERVRNGRDTRLPALTLAPTLTEVCRTSFFCGAPKRGGQADERTGLAALARRREVNAVLFHKDDLERSAAGSALPQKIVDALEDRTVGLVAVVLNTIDESLRQTGPEHEPWGVDRVAHLRNLLAAAYAARRAVVVTADHGHVVERRSGDARSVNGATSARSRAATADDGTAAVPGDDEILLRGPRVVADGAAVILPWREDLRYTALKAGYHGGASPAEMVVPVLMFTLPGQDVRGWREAPAQQPIWWLRGTAAASPHELTVEPPSRDDPLRATQTPLRYARPPRVRAQVPPDTATLFELPSATAPAADGPTRLPAEQAAGLPRRPAPAPSIVDEILGSEVFARQRKRLGRQPVDQEQLEVAMRALAGAGPAGLPNAALAAALRQPEYRVRGLVVTLQRLLNIEGYEVVSVDADGVSVVMNEQLLREQFELGPP